MKTKTEQFLESYLNALEVEGYAIKTAQDEMGFLITVAIPRQNRKKIGILKGRQGKNLQLLKQLLRVVGFMEKKNPFLIIKLIGE